MLKSSPVWASANWINERSIQLFRYHAITLEKILRVEWDCNGASIYYLSAPDKVLKPVFCYVLAALTSLML